MALFIFDGSSSDPWARMEAMPVDAQLAEEDLWFSGFDEGDVFQDGDPAQLLGDSLGWDEKCVGMHFPAAKLGSVSLEGSGGCHSDLMRATWLSGAGTTLGE